MSRVKHNCKKIEGVDWEFNIEVGNSTVTANGMYRDDYEGWTSRIPSSGSAHPELPFLKLKSLKAKRVEGLLIDVFLGYECNDSEISYPGRNPGLVKRYHMEPSSGEEPIITSHLFKDLSDTEREAAGELAASNKTSADYTKAAAALTSDPGQLFIEKIRKGIDAYLSPGLIWVERFTTKRLSDAELHKIHKTTSDPPGDCPSAGSERNWLRLAPSMTPNDEGETFNLENRWQLSERGKWDEDFYPSGG